MALQTTTSEATHRSIWSTTFFAANWDELADLVAGDRASQVDERHRDLVDLLAAVFEGDRATGWGFALASE